jgi:hypothetical protein
LLNFKNPEGQIARKNPHFWDKQELGNWSKLALNFQMPFDIPLSIQKTDFSQLIYVEVLQIAYYSKAFSRTERKYCVTRRELLAVVASIKHFHHYLYGRHFLVRSDHGALGLAMFAK